MSARALAAAPAVVVGVVLMIIVAIVVHPLIGIGIGIVATATVVWFGLNRATASALSALGAQPLDDGVEPRLESLVESICASHGIAEPTLYTVASAAVDAAVVGQPEDTHLVVTTGMIDELDRLEMEAVIARQLSMFGSGVHAATVLAGLGSWTGPLAPRLRARLLDDRRLVRADFDAVAVTRYPPALAAAFEKAASAPRVAHVDRADHLWMVGSGTTSVQPDVAERVDALREL
ncbi:MAG: hypothetical protein AAGA37_08905 [Actinomycetota bacterium]